MGVHWRRNQLVDFLRPVSMAANWCAARAEHGPTLTSEANAILSKPGRLGGTGPDMTAREWSWCRFGEGDSLVKVVLSAPMEFDRAARDGDVVVRGLPFGAGSYTTIERDHWRIVGLDPIDISNPDGSPGRTEPKITASAQQYERLVTSTESVMRTWPRVGWAMRWRKRLRRSLVRWHARYKAQRLRSPLTPVE